MIITEEQLKKIAPYSTAQQRNRYLPHLNAVFAGAHINTPLRVAAFLAQLIHESGSFNYVLELADGKAYENRKDLGNTCKGDGVRYKGRGLIQVTGRANYLRCGQALGLDLLAQPELLEQPEPAVLSAAWFWTTHDCNALADKSEFNAITRVINGGYNGMIERFKLYKCAKKVLGLS
ncbi:MAG: glycoside hydrolase family 19 protein [Methylobacter sp.]|nr:MAG: glycoside hydrolase family 19 protein [Methylobacter sp.]